jgi:DNA-binding transcriptional MerR regulator
MIAADGVSIGAAIKETGLSEDTLRYYERIGLMSPVAREVSGRRRYTADDILWLKFITRMRSTGMSIDTLQRYAALLRRGDETAPERAEVLRAHAASVEAKINELRAALAVIHAKIDRLETASKTCC